MMQKAFEIHDYSKEINIDEAWVIYWKANHGAIIKESKLYPSLQAAKERVGCTEQHEAYAIVQNKTTKFSLGENLKTL